MSTMGARIKESRERKGLYQAQLAELIGVKSAGVISNWEKDLNKPDADKIVRLCQALDISASYLLDFHGGCEPSKAQNAPSDVSEEAKKLAVDYDEHLDTWGQKAVRGLADTEMARTAAERTAQAPTPAPTEKPARAITALPRAKRRSDGFAEIKVYEQPAAAGLGNYLDEPPFHMEQYPEEIVPEKTDFGVVISGDSMEPEIHDGATVFVQSCPTLEAGEVGIFILGGKAYCKMLFVDHDKRQVRLVSINKAYDDIVVGENDDMYTLGRVLGQYAPRFL